jgi:hypothetical protein
MPLLLLRCASALLLALAPMLARAAAAAAPLGLVTIVDGGDAVLVRDTGRFALAEGVDVQAGDIVETTPRVGIVRLELADGSILDLGPDTRLLLAPKLRDAKRTRASGAYLLGGWLKLAHGTGPAPLGVASALGDVTTGAGSTVAHVENASLVLFQESGQSTIAEAGAPSGAASRALKGGETYALRDGKASVQARPDAAFVGLLPSAFRDTLPARAGRFASAHRAAKPLPAPTYADLEPWLMGEPALRASLLPRWRRLAAVPEFRSALVAHRKSLPEWEPILFPPPPKPLPPANDGTVPVDAPAPRDAGGYGTPNYTR